MINVGELIRDARLRAGLTQLEVDTALGKVKPGQGRHVHFISRTENGHHVPQLDTLEQIANAMGYELVIRFKRKPKSRARIQNPAKSPGIDNST